ncbi:hypothetical protein [Staphylococcus cohnii]|uniref:Uncharacterized protein n=1 Tax=Staphylococcus cohnii subsp. cohnii TaxID=74704 RepID=A0A0M2NWV3_STACC|nr:hypothetical protein [Staphylococcus cohnii]KKI62984.1 hypothetical protein UF66_1532 [Staphylococcus cohnii subsp. cohnii]
MKKKLTPSKVITPLIAILYLACIVITCFFIDNSDVSTLVFPIVFYTLINIIIRNGNESSYQLRSNDMNDVSLMSFAITYIGVKLYIIPIKLFIESFFSLNSGQSDWFLYLQISIGVVFIFLIIDMLIYLILMYVLWWVSIKFNKSSHWKNDLETTDVKIEQLNESKKFQLKKQTTIYKHSNKGVLIQLKTKYKYK